MKGELGATIHLLSYQRWCATQVAGEVSPGHAPLSEKAIQLRYELRVIT